MITLFPFDNTIEYQENNAFEEFELSTRAMEDGKIKNIPIGLATRIWIKNFTNENTFHNEMHK